MRRHLLIFLLLAVAAFAPLRAFALDREAVLDSLEYTGFRYFWDEANPANGLIRDRSQPGSPASIAANGFGFSAICVAIDHGWISRETGRARVLTTLGTFWNGPQSAASANVMGYKGLYYHFLDMNTGNRTWTSELSTIDTALLFAGITHAREYFASDDPGDVTIRALADSILWRADWNWARGGDSGLKMGWNPETGFANFGIWVGYNEAMVMYILAIGSPTHGINGPAAWSRWTAGYTWAIPFPAEQYHVTFAPLFGHQYSHCWIDFRGIQDAYMTTKGITYFENSRRATIMQKENGRFRGRFAVSNPAYSEGYSDSLWGLTASDDPVSGYAVHGVPSPDNGTIAPTAALSSFPFAPDSVWSFASNMWNNYRVYPLWGRYGFTDAFNPVVHPWVDYDYLGIDQGPIVLMIENYRNNMVWARFMQNADIQRGLTLAGFHPVTSGVEPPRATSVALTLSASPNPFQRSTSLRFRLPQSGHVRLALFDLQGREVARILDEDRTAGEHTFVFDAARLEPGLYHYRLEANGATIVRKAVLLP